jgi:hypothetical protein
VLRVGSAEFAGLHDKGEKTGDKRQKKDGITEERSTAARRHKYQTRAKPGLLCSV